MWLNRSSGYISKSAASGFTWRWGHEWKPRDKWIQSMTLLAEEVFPRLTHLS